MNLNGEPVPGPEEIVQELREQNDSRRSQEKWAILIVALTVGFVVFLSYPLWETEGPRKTLQYLLPVASGIWSSRQFHRNHRKAVLLAAKLERPDVAPLLIDVLDAAERHIRAAAIRGLKVSLPKVRAEDEPLFSQTQQLRLAQRASRTDDAEFCEKALQSLARIGSADVVPLLDSVGQGHHRVSGVAGERVASAAKMASAEIRMRTASAIIAQAGIAAAAHLVEEEARLRIID